MPWEPIAPTPEEANKKRGEGCRSDYDLPIWENVARRLTPGMARVCRLRCLGGRRDGQAGLEGDGFLKREEDRSR